MKRITNRSKRVDVLGVHIDNLSINSANTVIGKLINSSKKTKRSTSYYVVKPYVEFITSAYSDTFIRDIINKADIVLPDGVSLQWASSYLYGKPYKAFLKTIRSLLLWIHKDEWRTQIITQNHGGPNQTIPLLKLAEKNKWNIGIIGGKPDEIITRKHSLNELFPELKNLYCWQGYFTNQDTPVLVNDIKSKDLDILFVAMGFPIQEKFIYTNKDEGLAKVLIGEGGTFDYDELGGKTKRASQKVQRYGLEWLWRVTIQPRRVTRLFSILKFIILVKRFSSKTRM